MEINEERYKSKLSGLCFNLIFALLGKNVIKRMIEKSTLLFQNENPVYKCLLEEAHNQEKECQEILIDLIEDFKESLCDTESSLTRFEVMSRLSDEYFRENVLNGENIYEILRSKKPNVTDDKVLNLFVKCIFEMNSGNDILNVDCKTGLFILEKFNINDNMNITGYCVNDIDYHIARARIYILNKNTVNVEQKALFEMDKKTYDKIYLIYPFNANYDLKAITPTIFSLKCANSLELGRRYSSGMLGVLCALENLKEEGVMVALVPEGALVNNIDNDIRKILVYSNYLDTIIALPSEMVPLSENANICYLLVLKKNRILHDKVTFINANKALSCFNKMRRIPIQEIEKLLVNNSENEKYKCAISRETIISENCYLGINRYMKDPILIKPIELKLVSKAIVRGSQMKASNLENLTTEDTSSTNYRLVNISDIAAEGYVKSNLTPVQIDDPKKFEKFCLEPGDLVITAKNTTFKSAVYEQEDDIKAIMTGNLVAIRLDQNKMNPYFLKAFLDSNAGQNVLASVQTGTTLKTLTVNNLAVMRVSCPSMETQEKIAAAYKSKLSEVKEYIAKYENAIDDLKKIYEREV